MLNNDNIEQVDVYRTESLSIPNQLIADTDFTRIRKAEQIEVETLNDLVSMVIDWNEQKVGSLYYMMLNGYDYYFTWIIIHDYYTLRGIPLIIYVRTKNAPPSKYILYNIKKEEITFSDRIQIDPGVLGLKIIKLKTIPSFLSVL